LGSAWRGYVGDKYKGEWHIQLTALSVTNPEKSAATALRHMPDVVATASPKQLEVITQLLITIPNILIVNNNVCPFS
jgi:hypothetical protein